MSRTIKNCFNKNLTFQKLHEAHLRARKGKTYKSEVIRFEINLENNLTNLLNNIKNDNYKLGKYHIFYINEPKRREIKALPYLDRIVHQWYIEEFIKPYIIPRLIKDSYACIDERGTHAAVDQVQKYMRIVNRNENGNYWILKCDIKKFFNSINADILFKIMSKYISDKKLLKFTKILVYTNTNNSVIGIPIGNYTSQFFANIYLNELDQYVKHTLRQKYYVRYMDDFILFPKTKEEAIEIKNKIESYINNFLNLEFNHKSRYYPSSLGLNFCGYRIFTTHKLLRNDSKTKIKRRISKWNKKWHNKTLNFPKTLASLNSWFGHIKHADSYKLKQKMINKCEFLYTENTEQNLENQLQELISKNTL